MILQRCFVCVSETWFTMGDGHEGLDCWRPDICICDQLRVAKYRFFSLFVGRKSLRLSRAQSKLIVTYARTSDSNDIDFVLLRLYSTSSSGFPRPLALFAMSFWFRWTCFTLFRLESSCELPRSSLSALANHLAPLWKNTASLRRKQHLQKWQLVCTLVDLAMQPTWTVRAVLGFHVSHPGFLQWFWGAGLGALDAVGSCLLM